VIDPRNILRLSILIVATACCFVICHTLLRTLNDEEATNVRKASLLRSEKSDISVTSQPESSTGKEPILQILREAGITDIDDATMDLLPTWEEVTYVHCCFSAFLAV